MTDIRRGDIVEVFGGVAEVQRVSAHSEGVEVTLLLAESRDKLSTNVLRRGGPDEREDDKHVRPEEGHEVDDDEADEDVEDDVKEVKLVDVDEDKEDW